MTKRPLEHWESTPEQRRARLIQDINDNKERLARLRDSFNDHQDVFIEIEEAIGCLTAAERIFKDKKP